MILIGNKSDLDARFLFYNSEELFHMMKGSKWRKSFQCFLWNVQPKLVKMLILYLLNLPKPSTQKLKKKKLTPKTKLLE